MTSKEYYNILEDFTAMVDRKQYEKMPYDMWRKMNRVGSNEWITANWTSKYVEFVIGDNVHTFPFGDHSFADFLDHYYIDDWEEWNEDPYHGGYYEYDGTYITPYTSEDERKWLAAEHEKVKYALSQSATNASIMATPKTEPAIEVMGLDTKADKADLEAQIADVRAYVDNAITNMKNTNENEKEITTTMKGFNFDFGPVNGNAVRMSMYGLAVKNKVGTFVSYDAKSGDIMDVDVFNFEGANFLYKMPVAFKDIAIGDVVIHHNAPMFVVGKSEDGKGLVVVDVIAGERKEVMLAKSPFGFNFATKVVNFLGNAFNGAASAENPFGNMWMLFALSGENKDMKEMLPFMLMANGGMDTMNPMMFYCLMGKDNVDPMLMAMAMGAFNPATANTCNCGGNCGNHN